jgi:hypothetical protein
MKDWKHLLVREVEAARTRHPQARMTLWDFSGYSPLQCERIPAPGDLHSTTRFYWEGGHFKSTLGELVLRRMLGEEGPFGLALTAANFEQNEQRMAAERDSCATAYPEVFAGARSLILTARPKPR